MAGNFVDLREVGWKIDRSRVLDYQACPRRRYWSYHHNGTGLQRKSKSLALQFGSAFHEAAELLLRGDVEGAVARAHVFLDEQFAKQAVDLEMEPAHLEYGMAEQKAIVEGLVRGWWAYAGERFLADFEVLEVEQEGRAELGDGIELLFRPDALVREKLTGDLHVISWKTASTFGEKTTRSCQTDMQSMSEVWGLLNDGQVRDKGTHVEYQKPTAYPWQIEGVLYLNCVKGQRKLDEYLGFKTQRTPLAYCWKKLNCDPDDQQFAWKWNYTDEDSGKNTTLGKGWKLVSAWDNYPGGVKAWIEALAANEIRPRHVNALEAQFPQMLPVSRRVDEIESWKRQTVAQEQRIRNAVRIVELAKEGAEMDFDAALDQVFPQNTRSCFDFNSKCSMYDLCWNESSKNKPEVLDYFIPRLPNHPSEKEDGDE